MLESLRLGVKSWYFKTLLILLAGTFAVFGVGDIVPSGISRGGVISVGDIEINGQDLYRSFQRRLNQISRESGQQITVEQALQLGLGDQVVRAEANAALYEVEAGELGVVIGDDALRRRIHAETGFHNSLGRFDRGIFEQVIASSGMTEPAFIDRVRREMSRDQLVGSFAGGLPTVQQIADRMFQWRNERRIVDYVVLNDDPTFALAKPDDATLRKFHGDNSLLFTAPDLRKVMFVHLSAESAKDDIAATDKELQTAYEQRASEFHRPERRTLQQMILPDEDAAKKAVGMLNEGRDFVALAEQIANQDPDTTNFGEVTRNELPGDLQDGVFGLAKDEISKPLKGPFGWYLMRVTDIKPAGQRSFDEVKDILRTDIEAERTIEVLTQLSETLEDALGGGASLSDAAAQVGARYVSLPAVDRHGRGADGKPLTDLPQQLAELAFNTPVGEQSGLVELDENDFLIVQVESETPSTLRPYESVRNAVEDAWKAEQRRKNLERKTNDGLKRLKDGATLAEVAGSLNLGRPVRSGAFTRDGAGADANIPRPLVADIFALKNGEAASSANGTGYTIAVLVDVKRADPVKEKAARDTIGENLVGAMTRDLIAQYNNALRNRHSVEVDQRALNNLFLQN